MSELFAMCSGAHGRVQEPHGLNCLHCAQGRVPEPHGRHQAVHGLPQGRR